MDEIDQFNSKDTWNKIAYSFDKTRHTPWDFCLDFIESLSENFTVADIACGNGRHLIPLAKKCNKTYALDISDVLLDISKKKAQYVFDLFKRGELYSYVIAVCDAATAQKCPVFPGLVASRIDWSFEDPASFTGTHDEKIAKTRQVRDAIKAKIEEFIKETQ